MKLKSIPRRLGYILGAQWTRDLAWTAFTILLARRSPDILGQVVLALTFGYLVKTVADVGLNDFLLSTFARREGRPVALLGGELYRPHVVIGIGPVCHHPAFVQAGAQLPAVPFSAINLRCV